MNTLPTPEKKALQAARKSASTFYEACIAADPKAIVNDLFYVGDDRDTSAVKTIDGLDPDPG